MTLLEQYIPANSITPTEEFYNLGNASDIDYLAKVTHRLTFKEMHAKQGIDPLSVPNVTNLTFNIIIEQISGISATEEEDKENGETE